MWGEWGTQSDVTTYAHSMAKCDGVSGFGKMLIFSGGEGVFWWWITCLRT